VYKKIVTFSVIIGMIFLSFNVNALSYDELPKFEEVTDKSEDKWLWKINGYWTTDIEGDWDIVVPCDYPTIQEAVREANIGDRIFVREGIYNENVVIDKDGIIVQGEGKDITIVDGNRLSSALLINANYVKVSGFTFTNSPLLKPNILLETASGNIIEDNIVADNKGTGIQLEHSHGNIITKNTIQNNRKGITIKSYSLGNTIAFNSISNNRKKGIEIDEESNHNTIFNNNFIESSVNSYDACKNNWERLGRGNYWSDYTGYDLNDDQIGDLNYLIAGGENIDRYPLMKSVNISANEIVDYEISDHETQIYKPIYPVGKTITVDDDGDGDYIKIQYALDNADPGDIIEVYSGTYKENIEVFSGITLKGISAELGEGGSNGKPVITGSGDTNIVTISGNSSVLSGFEIKNAEESKAGIKITGNFNTVNGSNITDCGYGISLSGLENTIQISNIRNNIFGIYATFSNYFSIKYNLIEKNTNGIVLVESNGLIDDNLIRVNVNNGILQHYCKDISIENNYITSHEKFAVLIINSENSEIQKNAMVLNVGGGISLFKTTNCIISDNDFNYNLASISLWFSEENQIIENTCWMNNYGIVLSYSDNNDVNSNNLRNSTKAGIYLGMSKNNVLESNTMTQCSILVDSYDLSCWWNDVDTSNTVNGKTVYYLINETGLTSFPDAGQIILVNCNNCVIENLNFDNVSASIELSYSNNNMVINNRLENVRKGIVMVHSCHNLINNNTIFNGTKKSIFISWDSNYNQISNNTLDIVGEVGLALESCDNNIISDNKIVNKVETEEELAKSKTHFSTLTEPADSRDYIVEIFFFKIGIALGFESNNNIVRNNEISDLNIAIAIGHIIPSHKGNIVINNSIYNNDQGVVMGYSNNNYIIGNRIINSYFSGIAMDWLSDTNYLLGNHIQGGYGGIGLRTCNNNLILGNTICEFDNYWDNYRPLLTGRPKLILGGINLADNKTPYVNYRMTFPWINMDKNPASEVNNVSI